MTIRDCPSSIKEFDFTPKHESLLAILLDHNLAALGDAYVNFVYSLVLSERQCRPVGRKVDSSVLAASIRKAGLRSRLPSRTDRHKQADAAEALIVYAWLTSIVSLNEAIKILRKEENLEDAFSGLLQTILERLEGKKA